MTINTEDLQACAIEAAKTAGMHAIQNEARRREYIGTFKHDVKLQLDVECQAKATEVIQSAFPSHNILGEEDVVEKKTEARGPAVAKAMADKQRTDYRSQRSEEEHSPSLAPTQVSGLSPQPSPYTWVIDPIDGTVNFSHGLPWWCTCIAVMNGDETVAAAIYAPVADELYTAALGIPSRCNDETLQVSDVDKLANSIIMTGLDKNVNTSRPTFTIFTQLALNTRRVRAMGCAALDLCVVARGQADGYFETGIFLWDVAAAGFIVTQAGGKADTLNYNPETHSLQMAASNGIIHDELMKCIEISDR